jgi:hypothetical protein
LSSTSQQELADILRPKYSPWTATDVESENRRLNQILQMLTRYFTRPATTPTAASRGGVPLLGISAATASGSGAQASNSRSTAHRAGCATPRVQSRVTMEEKLSQPESDDAHLLAPVAQAPASHMWTIKDEGKQRKSRNSRRSPQPRKSSGTHVPRPFCSGCKHSQYISRSARLLRTSI